MECAKDTSSNNRKCGKEISDLRTEENKALYAEITLLQMEITSMDKDFVKVSNEKDKLNNEILELNDIVPNLKGHLRQFADEKRSILKQLDTAKAHSGAAFQLPKANAEILRQMNSLRPRLPIYNISLQCSRKSMNLQSHFGKPEDIS